MAGRAFVINCNAAIKADYEKAGITDSPKLHAEGG